MDGAGTVCAGVFSKQTTHAAPAGPHAGWAGASDEKEPNLQDLRAESLELEVAWIEVLNRKNLQPNIL